ncbi:MAG: hypothetical protein AB7V25_16980 [Mangrovibacterium sp.]
MSGREANYLPCFSQLHTQFDGLPLLQSRHDLTGMGTNSLMLPESEINGCKCSMETEMSS